MDLPEVMIQALSSSFGFSPDDIQVKIVGT
jgi:hypothetical protein